MRIGVRAHDFGKLPAEVLSERIAEKGFSCIQLALMKAIEGIDSIDGKLSPGFAYQIGSEFHRKNIQIAVLGCYINPIHPDREERERQIGRFREHIRYARDFGCSVVATETGSYNADCSYHPENHGEQAFRSLAESVGEMVEEAEKFGVIVGIEGVATHVIHNPARMKALLGSIPSGNLQVVFDPVNLLTPGNYMSQKAIIEESFCLFGDRIVAVHVKDFVIDGGGKTIAPIGKGLLDFTLLLKNLRQQKPFVNILMEDAKMDTMDESKDFLRRLSESIK